MDFEYLRKIGRFQWMCIIIAGFVCAVSVQTNIAILFIAPKIDFYCNDQAPSFQNLTSEQQENLMTSFGKCYRPDLNFSLYTSEELLQLNASSTEKRKCDTGYVYDRSDYAYTVTEQYNLVCGRKWLISMSKTAYMLGYFIGALGSGAVGDRFGRRVSLILFTGLTSLFNVLSAFSPNVEVFLVARCLAGACSIASYTAGLILNTELVRKDERKMPRSVLSMWINVVMALFVGVTVILRDHRHLQCFIAGMMAINTVIFWFVLPESPRWLTAEDRHEEANKVVDRIAKFNSWSRDDLQHVLTRELRSDHMERKANITDLFRTPVLRKRIFTLCVLWFTHILTFYAIVYNMGSFYPDLRLSLLISCALEFAFIFLPIFTIDVMGRQVLTFLFMGTGGVACLIMTPFMGQGGSPALLVFAVVGKLAVVWQFFVSYIYTQELMPTVVRSLGLGLASTVSRVGGMLAPQIALLDDLWAGSSTIILGCAALIGAGAVLLLPDTTTDELPQSIADGEAFKAKHVYKFDRPRLSRKERDRHRSSKDGENGTPINITNDTD